MIWNNIHIQSCVDYELAVITFYYFPLNKSLGELKVGNGIILPVFRLVHLWSLDAQ